MGELKLSIPDKVICSTCNKEIDKNKYFHVMIIGNGKYFFCSDNCRYKKIKINNNY